VSGRIAGKDPPTLKGVVCAFFGPQGRFFFCEVMGVVMAVWACPVRAFCTTSTHCPYCVDGSEYTPARGAPLHPAAMARHADRRAARQTPAARRGRRARQRGLRAERDAARAFGGTVVPGSGRLDGWPGDVRLPDGWRVEVKERSRGFGWLYRHTATHGAVIWTEPDGLALAALTPAAFAARDRLAPVPVARPGGFRQLRAWLAAEGADVLVCRRRGGPWVVVAPAARFWPAAP